MGVRDAGTDTAFLLTSPACVNEGEGCVDPESAGLWRVEHVGAGGLEYTKIPFSPDESIDDNCTAEYLIQYAAGGINTRNRIDFDPTSDIAGDTRLYVTSRDPNCGLYQVDFTYGLEDEAIWTKLLYTDVGTGLQVPSACTLATSALEGVTVSPDGEWALAWGSGAVPPYQGGVCAISRRVGEASYVTKQVVPGDQAKGDIWSLVAHPHIDDVWFYALKTTYNDCATCSVPGVFALERRYRPPLADWGWTSSRASFDDLEYRTIVDLDLGPGTLEEWPEIRHIYTTGAGFRDGAISW